MGGVGVVLQFEIYSQSISRRSNVAIYQQLICILVRMKNPPRWQQWKLKKKEKKEKRKLKE